MALPQPAQSQTLERLPTVLVNPFRTAMASESGEVVVNGDQTDSARIYVDHGRVAWVFSSNVSYRLSNALQKFAGLDRDVLRNIVLECQKSGTHFGETLRGKGLIDTPRLRQSLLWHNRAHFNGLLRLEGPLRAEFVRRNRRRYEADLLFDLTELFNDDSLRESGVHVGSTTQNPEPHPLKDPTQTMANIQTSLDGIMKIDGAIAAALVDHGNGLTLGTAGKDNTFNIEVAASGNTEVVRSKMRVMEALKLGSTIEDILITLSDQYHLIRMLRGHEGLFLYVAIDKTRGNLGLARHQLQAVEAKLEL